MEQDFMDMPTHLFSEILSYMDLDSAIDFATVNLTDRDLYSALHSSLYKKSLASLADELFKFCYLQTFNKSLNQEHPRGPEKLKEIQLKIFDVILKRIDEERLNHLTILKLLKLSPSFARKLCKRFIKDGTPYKITETSLLFKNKEMTLKVSAPNHQILRITGYVMEYDLQISIGDTDEEWSLFSDHDFNIELALDEGLIADNSGQAGDDFVVGFDNLSEEQKNMMQNTLNVLKEIERYAWVITPLKIISLGDSETYQCVLNILNYNSRRRDKYLLNGDSTESLHCEKDKCFTYKFKDGCVIKRITDNLGSPEKEFMYCNDKLTKYNEWMNGFPKYIYTYDYYPSGNLKAQLKTEWDNTLGKYKKSEMIKFKDTKEEIVDRVEMFKERVRDIWEVLSDYARILFPRNNVVEEEVVQYIGDEREPESENEQEPESENEQENDEE